MCNLSNKVDCEDCKILKEENDILKKIIKELLKTLPWFEYKIFYGDCPYCYGCGARLPYDVAYDNNPRIRFNEIPHRNHCILKKAIDFTDYLKPYDEKDKDADTDV